MRKLKYLLFVLLLFTCFNVKAAINCEDTRQAELIKIANSITLNYDKEKYETGEFQESEDENGNLVVVPVTMDRFIISIYNITSDVYIEVTNSLDSSKETFLGSDYPENVATFKKDYINEIVDYTIKIYSADASCYGNLLTTKYLQTPFINIFSNYTFCLDNPDLDICQIYLDYQLDYVTFTKTVNGYLDKYDDSIDEKENNAVTTFINNNKYYLIGGACVLVLVSVSIIVVVVKKRKNREF